MGTGYGRQRGLSAEDGLAVAGLLAAAVAWMLATGYDSAEARCREQGSYCLNVGRTYNENGDAVRSGLWWGDDGVRHEVKP